MQLESVLESSARQWADRAALVCGPRRIAHAELEADANRLAHALVAGGIQRGDRVAVHLDNGYEAVVSVFGILKAGAAFVLVNPTVKAEKLRFVLNNCRAAALIAPATKLAAMADLWAETPHLRLSIVVGEAKPEMLPFGTPTVGFRELLRRHQADDVPPPKRAIDVDLAAVVYTSGTTGHPKGVMLTHQAMLSTVRSINACLENSCHDVVLNMLPLAFGYGLYQVLTMAQVGGCVVLERSLAYPHAVLQNMVARRATALPLVPTMAALLLQLDLSKYDFSALRCITNAGAALPTGHLEQLRRQFPQAKLYSMYGQTECQRITCLPPEELDRRPNSVGRGIPNLELYLVDADGRRLPPGSTGELVVRGANLMRGYWELTEETARKLRPGPLPGEVVLHTGDLFRTDAEGFLYFVARQDDIIKSRGEKVSPKEVEDVLSAHPEVAEAAVVGVPDAILGQAVKAIVVPRAGAMLCERDVLRHCREHLEDFMVPKFVEIRPSLPRTGNGKIDKRELMGALT